MADNTKNDEDKMDQSQSKSEHEKGEKGGSAYDKNEEDSKEDRNE
ncbi:MAG: hypothetical protein ACM3IJ_03330 [Candidatus Levyibacteriota bacterium]